MRIQVNFTRPIFADVTPEENPPAKNGGVIAQDTSSEDGGNILKDMLWHPKGIGQSSSWGKRYISPDEIQNMTPEQMAEMERRKKMADAGTKAGTMGAGTVGGLLPTGSAGEAAATTLISETVDHVVETNTTAPKEAPPTTEKTDSPAGTSATQTSPQDPKPQTTPPSVQPVPQRDLGVRLNPNYMGIIDPEATEKTPTPAPNPQPKPKGSIKVTLSHATDNANLTRETDAKGDAELKMLQLRSQGLLR